MGFAFSNAIQATFRRYVPSDFNGDGISDIALGSPGESIGSTAGAGAVILRYGNAVLPSDVFHYGGSLNGPLSGRVPESSRWNVQSRRYGRRVRAFGIGLPKRVTLID